MSGPVAVPSPSRGRPAVGDAAPAAVASGVSALVSPFSGRAVVPGGGASAWPASTAAAPTAAPPEMARMRRTWTSLLRYCRPGRAESTGWSRNDSTCSLWRGMPRSLAAASTAAANPGGPHTYSSCPSMPGTSSASRC
jgi:hypothetical protein